MATARVRRLNKAHDMTFGRGMADYAGGAEAAAQRLRCRLLTILGEWFLDTSAGVPWWQPEGSATQPIMGGPKNLQYAEAVIKAQILGTDGIATIEAFSMVFNGTTRKLTVACTGTTVDGDVFNISEVGP
jgi:hypothetical protein